MPTMVWFINRSAPPFAKKEIQRIGYSNFKELFPVILHFCAAGWVTILGSVRQGPEDVAAVIQEHFDATAIQSYEVHTGNSVKKRKNHG